MRVLEGTVSKCRAVNAAFSVTCVVFFSHLDLKQNASLRKDCKSYYCLWILKPQIVNIHHFRKGGERFVVV